MTPNVEENTSVSALSKGNDSPQPRKAGAPRPIIHVGVHKTATNWFQKHFYPYVQGYRYLDRRLVRSTLLGQSPLAFDAAAARHTLGLDQDPPPIICEEDLTGVLHNGGLTSNYIAKEIANQLAAIAPDARIVLFIRSQTALAASCYQQYLREGGTSSVHRYLFPEDYLHLGNLRPLKVPRFDFSQFEFDRLIAHYDSLFGRDNVFIFAYEQFARDPQAFVREFCRRLEIEQPAQIEWRKINSSYRSGLIPIVRFLNLFTRRSVANKRAVLHIPYWYSVRKRLLNKLNALSVFGRSPSPRNLLGITTHQWIEQRFCASNAAIEKRIGISLTALGYCTRCPETALPKPENSIISKMIRN